MHKSRQGLRYQRLVLIGLAGVVIAGCEKSAETGPPMGDVTGTITYQGKPVAKASVVFLPRTPDTRAAAAVTDANGNYSLRTSGEKDGAIVGPYQVSIALRAPYDGPVPEGMSPAYAEELLQNEGRPLIPERYFSPTTSGLTADVKAGDNRFDFTLQD